MLLSLTNKRLRNYFTRDMNKQISRVGYGFWGGTKSEIRNNLSAVQESYLTAVEKIKT